MKGKKLLTMALVAALFIGAAVITNAAELDLKWYEMQNPDVVEVLGKSPKRLREHYEKYGKKEGRMANAADVEGILRRIFNAEEYAALYPDVKTFLGGDEETMFRHYMSFGLLEARMPSGKVSQETAVSLKKAVKNAMEEAGIEAEPGSPQLVEILTGTIAADEGGESVQAALIQAAPEVVKAVVETVEEVTNQTQAPVSSSVGSASVVISESGEAVPDMTVAKADWAPLADHGGSPNDELNGELQKVNTEMVVTTDAHSTQKDIAVVTFHSPESAAIPEHTNIKGENAYFFGIEVPYNGDEYRYNWGFTSGKEGSGEREEAAAIEAVNAEFSENKGKTAEDGENATFYWGLTTAKQGTDRWGYLAVKDSDDKVVAKYILDFTELCFDQEK